MNRSVQDKKFDQWMIFIVTFTSILCLLPLIYITAVSLSSNDAIAAREVLLWPVELTFESYDAVFADKSMINSMILTVWLTMAGTVLSMIMTTLCAYPLTKKKLKGRNFFLVLIVITMYFSGGMIPDYILVKSLNMIDTPGLLLFHTA